MTARINFEELLNLHGRAELIELFEKKYPPDYDTFLRHVASGVDHAISSLERNAKHYFELDEDQITTILVENLISQKFDASHDADYSGHLDVAIQSGCRKFFWGAEAKIHYDNEWLAKGIHQLEDSYLDGTTNRNHAGLLIYIKRDNASQRLSNWSKHFADMKSGDADFSISICQRRPGYALVSTQKLQRTGMPYHLRHIGVSLWRKRSQELLVSQEEQELAKQLKAELLAQEKADVQAKQVKKKEKKKQKADAVKGGLS